MLAFQRVSRLHVIECFDVPFDERKILAVMIGVTTRTVFAGTRLNIVGSVQASAGRYSAGNLRVTVQATEGGRPAKFVASGAVRGSV